MISQNITGQVFTKIDEFTITYGEIIFNNVAQLFLALFGTFYALKLVLMLVQKSTSGKQFTVHDLVKPIIITSLVSLALSGSHYIAEWIVIPAKSLATGLAAMTAALTSDLPYGAGVTDMLALVDGRLNSVIFEPCKELAGHLGLWNSYKIVGIWIIQILYIFVWFLFLALMVESLFRFMTFYAISPMLVPAFFFESTKSIASSGMKSLLHAVLTMFMAGVAMGLTLTVIGEFSHLVNNPDGTIKSDWLFGESYFALILIALVSISFHLKAPKIAANLAQIDDGAGVAGVVAGLGTAGVMGAKSMAMGGAGFVAKKGLKHSWNGIKSGGSYLYNKVIRK